MKALVLALSLFSVSAMAAYDNTWYQANGFSGEYPNGFSVIKEGVTVPARATLDKEAPATIACPVEFKAVYHPWNDVPRAQYITMSKIVPLTVKEDFNFETDDGSTIPLKKGDVIEYLVYGAEGWFTVRINGQEYGAGQDLFEKVEDVPADAFQQHEYFKVSCGEAGEAYIFADDLMDENQADYIDGIASWSLGWKNSEYGKVVDLTDEDLPTQGQE